jgi:hypothetical protein
MQGRIEAKRGGVFGLREKIFKIEVYENKKIARI